MGQAKKRRNAGLGPRSRPLAVVEVQSKLPHYTAEKVVELLNSNDPRIRLNEYGTAKCILLSSEPGYFKYSDKNGGTATFYVTTDKVVGASRAAATNTPLFTAAIEITDKMRKAKCTSEDCDCDSNWLDLCHSCGCTEHHEGEHYDVIPRIEVCNAEECDGQHGHLLSRCPECFMLDEADGKELKDITADNLNFQLQ